MALLQLCLGLRVSELLALRWKDVDWIGSKLNVEHGNVNQHLDAVKTEGSRKTRNLDPELLSVLSSWKQRTGFGDADDWLFPSPVKLGRLPQKWAQVFSAQFVGQLFTRKQFINCEDIRCHLVEFDV
jgi:integrase